MARNHFNAKTIAALNLSKPRVMFDHGTGGVPGLFVRVTPAGTIRFGLRYKLAHQRERTSHALGGLADWTRDGQLDIEALRAKARELLERHADGIAPAVAENNTMQAVYDFYLAGLRSGAHRRKMKGVPARPKTIAQAESVWRVHLQKKIGEVAPQDFSSRTVAGLHAAISKQAAVTPEGRGSRRRGGLKAANRAISFLKAAWNLSASDGLTQNLHDPFKGLTRNHEAPRKVFLKKDQAPAFLAAIDQEAEPFRTYWWLMILTGARGAELRALRWEDVDLANRVIVFRDVKNGEPTHEAPLGKTAVKLLKKAAKLDEVRVFPIADGKDSWARIRARTGLTELRPHDVRRTVGTWLAAAGRSANQIGAMLGHKSNITSQVYIQLAKDEDTKAEGAALQDQLVQKHGSNVVQFRKRAREAA